MTEKTIEEKCKELGAKMEEMFGDRLADPDVFPRVFAYQAKLAVYEMKVEEANAKEV